MGKFLCEVEERLKMKKLFISQPMNGKTEEEILAVRKKAIESAKVMLNEDVEVIESYFEDYNSDKGCVPLKYLAKSLELLADADVAYFAKGWESARGCRIENQCAIEYGIDTIEDYKNSNSEHGYNFGTALEILKHGGKVAREGWNGKKQYIQLATGISYKSADDEIVNCEHDAIGNKAIAFVGTSGVQMGWLASQADMLAEDWVVVE
jgi:hypothetical protein